MRVQLLLACLLATSSALAECDLDEVVGYTLIAVKTVDAYIEGGQRKDGFEGCNYDRIIVFSDNTGVVCAGYGYSYAYRPKAYVFSDGSSLKMCVRDRLYTVRRIP